MENLKLLFNRINDICGTNSTTITTTTTTTTINSNNSNSNNSNNLTSISINDFDNCDRLIHSLDLFSPLNETIDDINTAYIPFLLLSVLRARYLDGQSKTLIQRLENIPIIMEYYKNYIDIYCHLYNIDNNNSNFNDDYQKDRNAKINRINRIKELKNIKIENKNNSNSKNNYNNYNYNNNDGDDIDEEIARKFWSSQLEIAFLESLGELHILKMELNILNSKPCQSLHSPSPSPSLDNDNSNINEKNHYEIRPPLLISKRQTIREQEIFKKGWSQPTMTIDEYLHLELQRGAILSSSSMTNNTKKKNGNNKGNNDNDNGDNNKDDDDDYDSEKETRENIEKSRQWDEFKDDNPRGSGNQMGNYS